MLIEYATPLPLLSHGFPRWVLQLPLLSPCLLHLHSPREGSAHQWCSDNLEWVNQRFKVFQHWRGELLKSKMLLLTSLVLRFAPRRYSTMSWLECHPPPDIIEQSQRNVVERVWIWKSFWYTCYVTLGKWLNVTILVFPIWEEHHLPKATVMAVGC